MANYSSSHTIRWAASGLLSALALAFTSSAWAQSRGELLYTTHCIACHTTQMHWRDNRQATDWASLRAQVQAWQGRAMLQWSEDDIIAVTRHLNDNFYRFPQKTALWVP